MIKVPEVFGFYSVRFFRLQVYWSKDKETFHQGEFSIVASIKVKFFASVTKNGVLSF